MTLAHSPQDAAHTQPATDGPWTDRQRTETAIKSVRETGEGYDIQQENGWGCWLAKEHGVVPSEGEALTLWGRGIGYAFRGMAVGDRVAFYRTEADDALYQKVRRYGADAADWLRKWDAGEGVWTIEMGGLSAGYDQAINLITAEMVRALLKLRPEIGEAVTDDLRDAVNAECTDALDALGLSGAQYGAGLGLAVRLYKFGPISVLEGAPEDRRIQASRSYPTLNPVILDALAAAKATPPAETVSPGTQPRSGDVRPNQTEDDQ